MIIYLGQMLPFDSCGSLNYLGLNQIVSTALHASKDFAVSPTMLPWRLFLKESVCFHSRRHCSHLYIITDTTGITRYLAPILLGRVRTFLLRIVSKEIILRRSSCPYIITQNYKFGSMTISSNFISF